MKKTWFILVVVCSGAALCGALVLLYILPLDFREHSPVQPIAFSHAVHAGSNAIPCRYCHRSVDKSLLAGIPSVMECRACHLYIAPESPEIKKVMHYWETKEPVPWVRVNSLPDHVYFPHMMHVRAGIECSVCHGQVAGMERVSRTATLKMGWCLGCHRLHRASIDCWTCHI
ncbi:MAG: cytochrome c3 family protein [Pelobacteraceae bacterium]